MQGSLADSSSAKIDTGAYVTTAVDNKESGEVELSVVMPCLNEEQGVEQVLTRMPEFVDQVLVVDRQPDRLRLAEKIGATPVDDSAGDAVQQVLDATRGEGADKGVEAVGYQAHDHQGREQPGLTINSLIQAVRPTGRIGVVGVFVPEDPAAADDLAKEGKFGFDFGTFFFKGQSMGTGQANVKQYNRQLRNLIHRDKLSPGLIVSHELNLDQAAEGYENFDNRLDGWTKVLLHP